MPEQKETREIIWKAPEFIAYDKSAYWYVIAAIIGLALVGFAIYQKSIITGIMFGLLTLVVIFYSRRSPRALTHKIDSLGITVGDTVHPYKTIKSFWIIYEPEYNTTLNLETTAYLNREISLQLANQDPVVVRRFLKKFLFEDLEKEETITDTLARKLRF